jgi:hypothetical protein
MAGQPGFIYLLKVRQHIDNDVNIYKVGQTGDLANRLHGYPKGSTLIMALQVADKVLAERAAISALRSSGDSAYPHTPAPNFLINKLYSAGVWG